MTFRPRIRTIKPEMWADEKVGQVSRDARLLFVGLITMADDEGRLRGMPAAILGHVFPYDDDALRKLRAWLASSRRAASSCPTQHGGVTYFYLPGFVRHQVINKSKASTLPGPPPSFVDPATGEVPDDYGTTTGNVQYVNGSRHV
jgi:hypothetical protein